MARYISPYLNLAIFGKPQNVSPPTDDTQPVVIAQFYMGELIIGDPTTDSGAGNDLDWSKAWDIFPGTDDKEKAGLDKTFFYAPYIDSSGTLTSDKVYVVISGSITHNNVVYTEGQVFVASGTSFTDNLTNGTSYVALAVHSVNFPQIGFEVANPWQQDLTPWYIANQLGFTDSSRNFAEWDVGNWRGRVKPGINPWNYVAS